LIKQHYKDKHQQ